MLQLWALVARRISPKGTADPLGQCGVLTSIVWQVAAYKLGSAFGADLDDGCDLSHKLAARASI